MGLWLRGEVKNDALGIAVQVELAVDSEDYLVDWTVPDELQSGGVLIVPMHQISDYQQLLRVVHVEMSILHSAVQIYRELKGDPGTAAELAVRLCWMPTDPLLPVALERLADSGLVRDFMWSTSDHGPTPVWGRVEP